MTFHPFRSLPVALILALGSALPALAEPAGTLLFVQDGVRIINADGQSRPARQGEVLQTGERLQTPPNAITQLKLPDGSLMGVRPGAELRIDPPAVGGAGRSPEVALLQGAIRVVGVELMDRSKTSAVIVKAGQTTLQLTGADIESAVLKPEARPAPSPGSAPGTPAAGESPGTYNRLAAGAATLRSGTITETLPMRQVSFVPANSPIPTILATVGPTVFAASRSRDDKASNLPPPAATGGRPDAVPPRPTEGVPVFSNMTSSLTAPRPSLAGGLPAAGPNVPGPRLVFSPISGVVNPVAGDRAVPGPAPMGGAPSVRPLPPPPPPPIRQVVICRQNPIIGRPQICT